VASRDGSVEAPGLYVAGRQGIQMAVLVLVARALLTAVAAVLLGRFIDLVVAGRSIATVTWWLAAFLVCAAGLGWAWPLLADHTRNAVESDLRGRILDRVVANPKSTSRAGEVTNRATEGVGAVGALAGRFIPQLVGGVVIPLMICAVVSTIDVPSALILLVTAPAVPLLLRGMEKRFTSVTERYNATADRLTSQFLDGVQGMKTLRSLDASADYGKKLETESRQLRDETMALLRVNQLALLVVDSLFTMGTVVAAGAAASWRLQGNAVTVGEAVAIILLGVALIEPISQIGRFFYVGAVGRAAARDIEGALAASGSEGSFEMRAGTEGWVDFNDVSFAYEPSRPVLRSVSFRVESGETVGLVGPSGAGKSTIAALVSGLLEPDQGEVGVGGRVAVVSQRPFLFHGTLRENLLLADPSASEDQLWNALETAELAGLVRGRQGGLDLDVGERGLQLSGGEAQRLTIARLILADSPIVVLDEPTSNVDIETESRVRRALDRLMVGRTVLVIAHRKSTLAAVDRVLRLSDGIVSPGVTTQ
jgi:ATP-binding cassette, subfamily C, bacterial CydD